MNFFLPTAPLHINWNITYICNFNCGHCYSRTRLQNELPFAKKVLVAQNIIKNQIFNVNLGGGEPLLSEDIYAITELLANSGVFVNLSTNGWNLSDDIVVRLSQSGIGGVSISLDSSNPHVHDQSRGVPGSFESVLRAIKKYVNAGISTTISTTITSSNYPQLEEIIKLGVSLKCNGIDFKRLKLSGNAVFHKKLILTKEQEATLFYNIPVWKTQYPIRINLVYGTKKLPGIDAGCPCGITSLSIMDNGDIAPCVYSDFSIGNAIEDDLGEIWRHSKHLQYLREHDSCLGLKEVFYAENI